MNEARKVYGSLDEALDKGSTARLSVHAKDGPENEWRDTGEDVEVAGLSCDGAEFPESLPAGTRLWARTQPPSDQFVPVAWGPAAGQSDVGEVGEPVAEPKKMAARQAKAKPAPVRMPSRAEAKAAKASKSRTTKGKR